VNGRVLRIGLIGAGRWGARYITTIGDGDRLRLVRVARAHDLPVPSDCEVTTDWRSLIAAPDLDGVINASPPSMHAEMAVAALEADRPALVEKPLALDVASARAIQEIAHRRRAVVLAGHVDLFHPAYRELKRRVGRPTHVRCCVGGPGPVRPDVNALWDYGPHALGMALDLAGRLPVDLEVRTERVGDGTTHHVVFSFDGMKAELSASNALGTKERWLNAEVGGGAWRYDDRAPDPLTMTTADTVDPVSVPVATTPPLTQLLMDFSDAIVSGRCDLRVLDVAADTVELLSRCGSPRG
jgi:predicted dehydrogenase